MIINTLRQEFISSSSLLIKLSDDRRLITRHLDLAAAMMAESESRKKRQYNPLKTRSHSLFSRLQEDNTYDKINPPWKQTASYKLVVFIHGMNSSPLAWSRYLTEMSNPDNKASFFIPYVYKKGYCKLSEAADPILDTVQSYADQYPDNPIYLIGHSNGARIAAYIEQGLNAKKIHLVSISGSHCGSKLMKWINMAHLTRFFGIPEELIEELSYLGEWPTNKLIEWQDKQRKIEKKVERVFYATADDCRVFPIETSFPNLPNSSYYLCARESHVTLIDGVKDRILSYISE